jgi:hypothetical protein
MLSLHNHIGQGLNGFSPQRYVLSLKQRNELTISLRGTMFSVRVMALKKPKGVTGLGRICTGGLTIFQNRISAQ